MVNQPRTFASPRVMEVEGVFETRERWRGLWLTDGSFEVDVPLLHLVTQLPPGTRITQSEER